MESLEQIKTKAKELLIEDINAALNYLLEASPKGSGNEGLERSLIMLKARYSALKRDRITAIISDQEFHIRLNNIRSDLLSFINELSDQDISSGSEESTPVSESRVSPKLKGHFYWLLPSKMLLNQPVSCLIRIIPEGAQPEEDILRNMNMAKATRISEEMAITMAAPEQEDAFQFQHLSPKHNKIRKNGYTDWFIRIKPLKAGSFPLFMKLSLIEQAYGKIREREIVLEHKVEVVSDNITNTDAANRGIKIRESVIHERNVGQNFGLIIGISDYQHYDKLGHPLEDAKKFKALLDSKYAFEEIIFLENPLRDDLLDALDELEKKIDEKDSLLVFFAGHGHWEDDAQEGFWLPKDAEIGRRRNWIANSTLQGYFKRYSKCQHILLIADSCFSGSLLETRSGSIDREMDYIQELFTSKSRQAMTSGAKEEVPDRSPFFKYLFKKLDENDKDFISAGHLFHSIRDTVINNSKTRQKPQLGKILESGDEGGDFIFMKREA